MPQLSIFERVYVDGVEDQEAVSFSLVPAAWLEGLTPGQILDYAHKELADPTGPFGNERAELADEDDCDW